MLLGIFRDVFLLAFDKDCNIADWFIRTDFDTKYEDATLNATVEMVANEEATLELTLWELAINGGKKLQSIEVPVGQGCRNIDISLSVSQPSKWTAETPYLYNVQICLKTRTKTCTVNHNLGFRKIERLNGLVCVNGTPIRFRGVNRHDHHPRFGRAVPVDFIRRDLLLMKSNNINAVRCSHYPSHPKLFELADELGLWVMDEADLECHGFNRVVMRAFDIPKELIYSTKQKLVADKAAAYISDNPAWKAAYIDRIASMFHRDKNHPCIIFWSFGNESFYGRNHVAMYEYIKKVDPERIVHYEGDIDAETTEIYSFMYRTPEELKELANTVGVREDGSYDKAIILCEYGHAMGNGPGMLDLYEEAFQSHPRLQGGWIWEWANHGLWKEEAGKGFYAFGGEFGDYPNDGTFVMSGICHSTHSPSAGLIEYKKVSQPLKVSLNGDSLLVQNLYNFIDVKHLIATYQVEAFGTKSVLNPRSIRHPALLTRLDQHL